MASQQINLDDKVTIPIHDKESVVIGRQDDWFLCEVKDPSGVDWGGWNPKENPYPRCWFPASKLRKLP